MGRPKTDKTVHKWGSVTLPDGRTKKVVGHGRTEREAVADLERIKAEYKAGIKLIGGKTIFADWVETWLVTYKKPYVTTKTYGQTESLLRQFFLPQIGHLPLEKITQAHIQGCLNAMQGYAPNYIRKAKTYVTAAFKAAQDARLIIYLPTNNLIVPKATKSPRRALTTEERQLFLACVPKHHHGPYFGIMYACGLRPGEARALTYDSIDWKNKTLTVHQAAESGAKNIKAPKTIAGYRTVPMPDWYARILSRQPRNINGYVFNTEYGNRINEQAHRRAWHGFTRIMNIEAGAKMYRNAIVEPAVDPEITPYYLRHTYAQRWPNVVFLSPPPNTIWVTPISR